MKTLLLVLVLAGCGSNKPKPLVVLDEPAPKQEPATAPAPVEEPPAPVDEPMPAEPTDKLSNDDLEPSKPGGKGQAAIAAKLNTEAIALVRKSKFADASSKFRDAVSRVPEASYFFNLCVSLHQEGKFAEALTSCDAVKSNGPTTALEAKTEKLRARTLWAAKHQGIEVK
jgi:TolA-binding protein